ncbi:hypothetical protein H7200_02340 [Candidatus Saccharibacteria bacterium]|nr:hypothetical protein [Candidatus Saccharibacteria bacterium]
MNETILTVRAVASEFARRLYQPVVIGLSVSMVAVIAILIWLLTMSAWWLLLALPLFILFIAMSILIIISGIVIRSVSPLQTKHQRTSVSLFVDQLQRISEVTQTPKFILLFRVVKDVIVPAKTSFIQSVITDSASVRADFQSLVRSFKK